MGQHELLEFLMTEGVEAWNMWPRNGCLYSRSFGMRFC